MDLTLNSIMEFEGIFLKSDEDESCKREDETIQPADVVEVKYTSSNATEDEIANDEAPLKMEGCKETEFVSVEQSGDDKTEVTPADAANTDDSGAGAAAAATSTGTDNEKSTSSRRKPKYVQKRGRGSAALNKKGRKVIPKVAATASNRVLRSKSPGNDARNQSRLLSEAVEQSVDDDSDEEWSYEDFDKSSKDRGTKSKRKSTKPRKLKLRIRRDYRVVKMVDVGVGDDVVDSDLEKAKLIAAAASEEESNDESSGEEYSGGKVQKKTAKLKGKAKPKGKKPVKDSNAAPVKKKRGPKPKLGGVGVGGGGGNGRRTRMSVCKVCGRAFRHVYLKAHMRTHTGEKPFSCEDCGKNFSTDCYLKMHRQSCHQDPEAFQCDICFRNLASRGSLKEHKRTHSDERPFQCHICQKVFRQPALLINHVKTHSTLTPYQCELCGKSYKYKRSMEMHKERIHDGVRKSFPCNICNKVFTRKTKLKDHTNWHFGKSRHLCEHCGKRFLSRKTLRTHLLIHEDKKPYPCEVCGKSFRQAHVLKRHITTHTGIKPFHCDVCGKQFIHRVYLIRHDCPKAGMSNKLAKKEMAPIQNMVMPVYGDALMMGSAMEQFLPDKTFLHNNKAL